MEKMYTAKRNLGGQKYLLKKIASVGKIYIIKSSLGGQNMY